MKKHPCLLSIVLGLALLAPVVRAQTAPAASSGTPALFESNPPPRATATAPTNTTPAPTPAGADTLGIAEVKMLPALVTSAGTSGTGVTLQKISQSLDSQLISSINSTHKFQIVARSDFDAILKELSFSGSGMVDAKSVSQMSHISGVKYLLVVTINDYQDRMETASFSAIGEQAQRRHVTVSAVANIYATETGKLLDSVNVPADDADARNNPAYIHESGTEWADNLPVALAGLLADKIAHGVMDALYPAKVVAKTGNQITINRGDGTGVAPGQIWWVYHTGEEMFDPDTHESLGKEEVRIGQATITEVKPKTAVAELMEDRGVGLGDVTRLVDQKSVAPAAPTPPLPPLGTQVVPRRQVAAPGSTPGQP
jgi:curli biogenesis system outer membrane secretion channel CsgG